MRSVVAFIGWLLAGLVLAAPAALVDRAGVFARARAVAVAARPELATEDLTGFRIAYALALLETGNPEGDFEVDLLLRSTRQVLPAAAVIAAAEDAAAAQELAALLQGSGLAWHYRTVRVRFTETGAAASSTEFSTLLLNRDPEPPTETGETAAYSR